MMYQIYPRSSVQQYEDRLIKLSEVVATDLSDDRARYPTTIGKDVIYPPLMIENYSEMRL